MKGIQFRISPLLLCDYYKVGHVFQYPKGTTHAYGNLTPRKSRIPGVNKMVVTAIQYFVKDVLIRRFNEDFFNIPEDQAVEEYRQGVEQGLGKGAITYEHVRELHKLGYLPIRIKAIPEGKRVSMKVPVMTIVNTHPDFYWLPNFLETVLSTTVWQMMTSATIAYEYKQLFDKYALETTGSTAGTEFQGHDFSMRGMSSIETAMLSGAGHLLSFAGTDSIPAINFLRFFYNAPADYFIGGSVPATEHSVMCAGEKDDEIGTFRRLINEVYPSGIVSIVSDTWDLWKVCTEYLPTLKSEILARNGKVVIRPDSGDPVDILCGKISNSFSTIKELGYYLSEFFWENEGTRKEYFTYGDAVYSVSMDTLNERAQEYGTEQMFEFSDSTVLHDLVMGGRYSYIRKEDISIAEAKGVIELLWDVFGGTTVTGADGNEYKLLDSHIGAIYGDSITLERAKQICERLKAKGFASTNWVAGIGSFTYQYNTRDTFGTAMKATWVNVNGEGREIWKDPITDDGMKKSAKGLLRVDIDPNTGDYILKDQCTWEEEYGGELQIVFNNGEIVKEFTLEEVRQNLKNS